MTSLHTLSPCCRVNSIQYGNRRRQCVRCRQTWRPHPRRHGRRRKRVHAIRVLQYLRGTCRSTIATARQQRRSLETVRADRRRSRDVFLRTPWLKQPDRGALLCIADALVQRIAGRWYTVYCILIRSIDADIAIIAPPLLRLGHEDRDGWLAAIGQLPPQTRLRIIALVSDGHHALRGIALERHWYIQRCHFHLKLSLGNYLSASPLNRQRIRSLLVYQAVDRIITNRDMTIVTRSLRHLTEQCRSIRARGTRKVLRGFLKYWKYYRTYLDHPTFHLPTTSNAAESLVQSIRDVQYRARGFRTPQAYERWVHAICLQKKTIRCRGFDQPN